MPKKTAKRSSLFLLELIIAILFFILAATACVKIFVHSRQLENDSIALNQAVIACTSVAEILRSESDPYDMLQEVYPTGTATQDHFYIYYDNKWKLCSEADARFTVSLQTEYTDDFQKGYISVLDQDVSIYQLEIETYLGEEVVFP